MPKKRRLDPVLGFIYLIIGITGALDITLEHPYDGFFIRETYNKNEIPDYNKVSKTFIINQASDLYKIKAQTGPFESQQTISRGLLDAVYTRSRNNNSLMHRSIVYNMDISAHVVSKDISPKLPRLQVLVHVSQHTKSPISNSGQHWCVQVFVEANGEELSSVCILNEKDKVCVAGINLHKEWWTNNGTNVKVSYSFTGIDYNDQCASASNAIIPVKTRLNHSENGIIKQEITVLNLKQNEKSFDEWKDQDILIDVPRERFHQGDSFEIPIRLEKSSDLQVFVMRARVRQGLRITGARMTDPSSQWSIHVDIKEHQKTGTVTAFVKDAKIYERPKSVLDVFRWQMEVAEETYDTRDMGRVVWGIEYQLNGADKENYSSLQDSKIVSQINIRSKDQQRLVPVLKVNEIVNVAILTGTEQVYPLSIYAVDDGDRFEEVTVRTKCHSVEVDVLKVASDCSNVYVDGAESRGSHNVSIIAKYGHTTAFMDITVWVPADRLNIHLSDTKLSRIHNWKVKNKLKRNKRAINPYMEKKFSMQKSRTCELRRQQCIVDVFTRFYIQTPKHTDFYMGRTAYLRVTDLVKSRLRMSDPGVATLSGNMVKGREVGRTEIQLLSPRNGHVLAAREIQVSHDKVSIVKLKIKLVTGMTLFVEPSLEIDGALVAIAIVDSQLRSNYHEGIVEVELVYSDKTTLPLRYVEPEQYFLKATTLDDNVIGVVPSAAQFQPHIVATGEGKGEFLKLTLELGNMCKRKKSKPIISETMVVEVDFSKKVDVYPDRLQMDAHYDTNRASDRWDASASKKVYDIKIPSHYEDSDFVKSKFSNKNLMDKDNVKVILKDDFEDLVEKEGGSKQQPLRTKTTTQGLTPLEIGMYVLLAVFCVAMTVFMVNCIVFFVRYKRKQKPQLAKNEAISNANDWVWIGRATLERNSVYTRSSRTLMPEEDFNGNLNNSRPLSTGSSCGSSTTGPSTAPNSNRNSTVSTYKGSECSIRITANPLTDDGGIGPGAMGGALPEETQSEGGVPQWDYEAMGMNYNQLLEYFDNLKESNA